MGPFTPDFSVDRRRFLLAGVAWFRPREIRIAGARLRVVRGRKSSRHYLHIHGNESTAREVLQSHARKHGGTAFFVQGDERNVPVQGGVIDPNRLFSRAGAERSLRALNAGWEEERILKALSFLDKQRDGLIKALLPPKGGLLFAVHNNSQGYSVRDEIPASDAVSLLRPDHPHDFFLATQTSDFDVLRKSPYNAILQNKPGPDDGSLSRLCARRGIRYVNLECKLGGSALQREMLDWAEANLP